MVVQRKMDDAFRRRPRQQRRGRVGRQLVQRAVELLPGGQAEGIGVRGVGKDLDVEPEAQAKGAAPIAFKNALKGGVLPPEFITAIEQSIRESARSGGRTGYPIVDLKITLVDAEMHDVESNELAFRFAASEALDNALKNAGVTLLEPVMKLEVVTPPEYLGDVMSDLLARRCEITNTFDRGPLRVIEARAPLAAMFGYSTAVRSLSQGRASYSMEPLEYAAAPDSMLAAMGVD